MAHAVVAPVVLLGVHAVELTHAAGEIGLRCFYQKVIMVVHKAVCMEKPPIAFDPIGKDYEKRPVVFGIGENILPGISPGGYMVEATFKFYAYRPSH